MNCLFKTFAPEPFRHVIFYSNGRVTSVMSEKAQSCRRKAAACWRAARRARDPNAKRQFEELAQAWLRLAQRAEHQPEWRVRFVSDNGKTDESES